MFQYASAAVSSDATTDESRSLRVERCRQVKKTSASLKWQVMSKIDYSIVQHVPVRLEAEALASSNMVRTCIGCHTEP